MICPDSLLIEHWAQYEHAKIKLNVPGATFLRGLNLDANGNPNGSGKSSLLNALYSLQFGDHQLAVRKKSLKSITRKNTRIAASYDIDSKRVIADMHGTDLKLTVDKRAQASRKKGDERTQLLNLLNTTPELWSASVHINGIASNPLVRGTSAARCQFLERAFDLDRWSAKYVKIGDIISAMKRADAELDEVKTKLAELGDPVDAVQISTDIERYEKRRSKLRKMMGQAQVQMATLANLPEKPERKAAQLQERIEKYEDALDDMGNVAAEYARWERAEKDYAVAKQALREARDNMPDKPTRELAAIEADHAEVKTTCAEIGIKAKHADIMTVWIKMATCMAREHDIKWGTLRQLHALSEGWVANLKGDSRNCPVCGNKLRGKVDVETLAELGEILHQLPDEVFDPAELPDYDKLKQKMARLAQELKEAEAFGTCLAEKNRALKVYRSIERIDRPKGDPRQARDIARSLSECKEQLSAAKQWDKIDETLDIKSLAKRLQRMEQLTDEADTRLSALHAESARAKAQTSSRQELLEKKDALEKEVSLRPAYQALRQAYSPNGMRLWLLQELLEAIIEGLNTNTHSTRDRQTYGYHLSRNRDLTLTASNVSGMYDIRMLSGAESSMFVLNFLTVLLPLLPANRRCSALFLDEVDANMSAKSRDIITREYFPRLIETVPSLYIITPNNPADFNYSGAHELRAVKEHGVSRLEVLS